MSLDAKFEFQIVIISGAALDTLFLLWFLNAMYQREAVKRNLFERGCTPVRIWWFTFSLYAGYAGTSFHVIYRDATGCLHKAHCYVFLSLMGSPFGTRRVNWTKDTVAAIVNERAGAARNVNYKL